jgi:ABC-type dipeptide/oligopeptide/nickel transport system permease subunit
MSQPTYTAAPRTLGGGYLFGVPVKDMGWFASLLMGFATGFLAFFASTFLAIISFLFYNSIGHHALDYSYTYSRIGLPIGILFGVLALAYLGMLWLRRITRSA